MKHLLIFIFLDGIVFCNIKLIIFKNIFLNIDRLNKPFNTSENFKNIWGLFNKGRLKISVSVLGKKIENNVDTLKRNTKIYSYHT